MRGNNLGIIKVMQHSEMIRDVPIGRNDLRIIKVWRHSKMKETKGYGTNGKGLPHF